MAYEDSLPSVIAVVGPTASGKSALAVHIARAIGGEVVSADSRQVYRGLDIGTGKITRKEMRGVPHHLLDVASPSRQWTVADWTKRAHEAIEGIVKRGRVPIICGGTGFYVDSLLSGTGLPNVPPDRALRVRLGRLPTEALMRALRSLDRERASMIDARNRVRIIRAIEIASALGRVPKNVRGPAPYRVLWVGIDLPNEKLRERIHDRLLARMRAGMTSEAKRLHARGLSYKRMRELGLEYRFLADHLEEKTSKREMLDVLEKAIWQYARRQRTWWRRNPKIEWHRPADATRILTRARAFTKETRAVRTRRAR